MKASVADMIAWSGAAQVAGPEGGACDGATADSREVTAGQLFVGVPGENVDGGLHAAQAIAAGAGAVLVSEGAWASVGGDLGDPDAAVLVHADPVTPTTFAPRRSSAPRPMSPSACTGS